MTAGMRTLHVITGPTAVGKTACAIRWAREKDAEILSCDALLFYRGMDIGTAKPTPEEQATVPHYGIDLVPAREYYGLGRYIDYARQTIEALHARGRRVCITGGSGFYLKAFYAPVQDELDISDALRAEVHAREEAEGLAGLLRELQALNPEGLGPLDTNNPRRVANALLRCRASGKPLLQLQAEFARKNGPFEDYAKETVVLERPREELHERAYRRARQMVKEGLVEEVERLRAEGLEENPTAATAIGYRETLDWLDRGSVDREALVEAITISTRRLIRKQTTWLKGMRPWVSPADK